MPSIARPCARLLVIVPLLFSLASAAGCRRLPAGGPAGTAGTQGPAGGGAQAPGGTGGDQIRWIASGGMQRRYLIHLPAGATSAAGLPVVLAFHGRLGTAEGMSRLTHLDRVADEHRFVVVYPQGYRRSWNDGRPSTPAHAAGVNDVAFVAGLIHYLVGTDHADASHVYATGMSNGAIFTERLGCDLTGLLAGIAPVAGPMPVPVAGSCHPGRPIAVLEIHGTDDPVVPYGGGRVRVARGTGCAPGAPVVLYTVTGGGHTWPGGEQYLPSAIIGPASRQFDASKTIWRFFAKLRRP